MEATQQQTPAVAGNIEHLGWHGTDPLVTAVTPPIQRGTNTVVLLPPAPAWATPAMAALLGRITPGTDRLLVLAAPALVAEWGATLHRIAPPALRIEAARGTARAARRLRADQVDVLVVSPETALALHTRSSLQPDRISAIAFAWPEDWDADEAVTVLLQDLPRDVQRVVFTSRGEQVDALIERYARKAIKVGLPTAGTTSGPVRVLPTPWSSRATAVADLLEVTDPEQLTIWTADHRDHELIRAALGGTGAGIALLARDVPAGGTIICYDPPDGETLARLVAAGDVILLTPPGTETHLGRIAGPRHPVPIEGAVSALLRRDATTRATIAQRLERDDEAALYLLAPLFERYEPQRVAAALYRLWRETTTPAPVSAVTADRPQTTTPVGGYRVARVWVGVGKKDSATTADLVAVLVREVGVDRALVGRIDLRDTYALVEVPADDAERIVQRLVGLTIRKRKLSARVDGGPAAEGPRGRGGMEGRGSRGGDDRPPRPRGGSDDRPPRRPRP